MGSAQDQLKHLKEQIQAGFLVEEPTIQDGVYRFAIPALEDNYFIGIPDSPCLQQFLASAECQDALVKPLNIGVALLDIVAFSSKPDDVQFKMIVRYQSLIYGALRGKSVKKLISIGDGTIFVFDEACIATMLHTLFDLDQQIDKFNDLFGKNTPKIERRIGVHVGPAYRVRDINGEENYIGTAMNLAQRVSTCVPTGDELTETEPPLKSTIYASEDARCAIQAGGSAQDFEFKDAGEKRIKHDRVIHVYAVRKHQLAV